MKTNRIRFVKHYLSGSCGTINISLYDNKKTPETTIIIPSKDGYRDGNFNQLINDINSQTYKKFELITVIGDHRQGRAINTAANVAKGEFLILLDDDTRLGNNQIFEKMLSYVKLDSNIGMAGVADIIPKYANNLQKLIMSQIPRRMTPIVSTVTESDMVQHPCCIIPKNIFFEIGGENELIPRGVDPYLRAEIRGTGYKVVVLPDLYIHHLPPATFKKFCKQFYRNGKMAAYVNKFYPEFVVELTTEHGKEVQEKRSTTHRIFSYIFRILKTLFSFKLFYLLSLILYLAGYIIGYSTLGKDDV